MKEVPMLKGSSKKLNTLSGICSFMVTNTNEIKQQLSAKFPKGTPIFNTDTRELLVAPENNTSLPGLLDHAHPHTHAPLVHSHMYGANQPWFLSEPRLWYIDDLPNHPELVQLNGQELTDDQATWLSEVYPGTKLATEKITTFSDGVFSNDILTLKADSYEGDYFASNVFNDELSIDNLFEVVDQWSTGSTDLTAEHTLTIEFKNDVTYRPSAYWICPGNGTGEQLAVKRPSPATWYFEGSNDGSTWTVLDQQSETEDNWQIFTTRTFAVDTEELYKYLRLRITSWNAGGDGTTTGLRRFYVFGRKNGVFSLPDVPSPNPDFAWVVPVKDQYVGMKREDVGDINYTSVLPQNLPSYRLPTDGRALDVSTDSELFAAIGHRCDKQVTPTAAIASDGIITVTGEWVPDFTETTYAAYIEFDVDNLMLGKYIIDCTGKRTPKNWVVEGYDGSAWNTLQTMTDVLEKDFTGMSGTCFIDTTVSDISCSKIRINVTEWNEGTDALGFASVSLFCHPVNQFYIPELKSDVTGVIPYIIRKNTANDVTASIISDLQQNIIDLTQAQSLLQNRVDKLDPEVITEE